MNIHGTRPQKRLKWNEFLDPVFSAVTKEQTMTAALATIVFLSAAWLALLAVAESVLPNLGKIMAALRAEPTVELAPVQLRVKARYQPSRQQRVKALPQLRAAA